MNLANVDLRLLVLFDALMIEGSVSRAAVKSGMSQPAASNALNRLRVMLGDRLFVRSSEGMRPTLAAVRISGPVRDALRTLQKALEPESFDPATSHHVFRLAVSDHASIVFLPKLVSHLKAAAPGVRLQLQPKTNSEVQTVLDSTEVDAAIGVIPPLPERFRRQRLFKDGYVIVLRQDHALAHAGVTLETYAHAQHLAIRPAQSISSGIDVILNRAGVERQIELTITQFLAVHDILRSSDMIATLLRRIAESFDMSDLEICSLPLHSKDVDVSAVWTRIAGEHAAHRWLRRQLAIVGNDLGGENSHLASSDAEIWDDGAHASASSSARS